MDTIIDSWTNSFDSHGPGSEFEWFECPECHCLFSYDWDEIALHIGCALGVDDDF